MIGNLQVDSPLIKRLSQWTVTCENQDSARDSCSHECFQEVVWPLPRLQLGAEKDDSRVWFDSPSGAYSITVNLGRLCGPPIVVNAIRGQSNLVLSKAQGSHEISGS